MARREHLLVLSTDDELVNAECIACQEVFSVGDEVVLCPRCKTPHHADCWRAAAGCKRHGCPQVAIAIRTEPKDNLGDSRYLKRTPQQKALLVIGIVLVFGALVFAMRPGPDPAGGRTKLSIMIPGGISETAYYDTFVDEFNQTHPDYYLSVSVTPSIAYDQKLVVLLGARDAPDVFSLLEDRYRMFAEHGGLLDLTPYIESQSELMERVFPEGLDAWKVDGAIYGLPHPGRNEVFSIWVSSPQPDLAWQLMVILLDKISTDWPEELKGELPAEPWKMPMPSGF
ncbi:MAG: extracellular solute-binding protein [Firmicutes bacterium]|nr:extracellular solute-binding protein [Bacillota bacterium]